MTQVHLHRAAKRLGLLTTDAVKVLGRTGRLELVDVSRPGAKIPRYRVTAESLEAEKARRAIRARRGRGRGKTKP